MIKGFIFDLDGVVTDTAEHHYEAWKRLCDEQGWQFDRQVNEQLRGISRMASMQVILDHNGISLEEERSRELANTKNEYYVDRLSKLTNEDYLDGAQALLTLLKLEGYRVGLGSASKNAALVLERLDAKKFFDAIGDGNSVTNGKPAPDLFLHVADQLGLKASECVVYEDAKSGIDAANVGGFHSVGIGPEDRVGHAHIRFDRMKEATLFAVRDHFSELFSR